MNFAYRTQVKGEVRNFSRETAEHEAERGPPGCGPCEDTARTPGGWPRAELTAVGSLGAGAEPRRVTAWAESGKQKTLLFVDLV